MAAVVGPGSDPRPSRSSTTARSTGATAQLRRLRLRLVTAAPYNRFLGHARPGPRLTAPVNHDLRQRLGVAV